MTSSSLRSTANSGEPDAGVTRLVERARGGDRAAFHDLYERYAAMVHGVLVASVHASDVEDLMQDVFLSAWRGLAALKNGEHVGGWLHAIARNRASRHHRRAKAPMAALPPDLLDGAAGDGAVGAFDGEESARILALLRTLPASFRETLTLRLVEGLTGPEIAERTGLTHGSVRVNLFRGMQRFRALLAREGLV